MFKFKVNTNKLVGLEARVTKDIESILDNREMKNEIGSFMVERIKYQARIGKPAASGATFPVLKDSTIKSRQYLEKYNTTHETYAARRSNVTLTGQLLDSIKYFTTSARSIIISFTGNHARYNSANGPYGRVLKNETIAKYLSRLGFEIFDSSIKTNETFLKRVNSIVRSYIRRGLRVR